MARVIEQRLEYPDRMRSFHSLALLLALSAAPPVNLAAAQKAAGIPFEVAFKPLKLSPYDAPALSPDGKMIAYSLSQQPPASEGTQEAELYHRGTSLFLKDLASGKVRQLGQGGEATYSPTWSPDGQQLAYYKLEGRDLTLYVYDRKVGQERRLVRQVADDRLMNGSVSWSPDGQHLAILLKPEGKAPPPPKPTDIPPRPSTLSSQAQVQSYSTVTQAESPGLLNVTLPQSEVGLVNVTTGSVQRITKTAEQPNALLPAFSPSGKWLLMPLHLRLDPANRGAAIFDLVAVRVADQKRFTVQSAVPFPRSLFSETTWGWHPVQDQVFFFKQGQLVRVDLTGSEPRPSQALTSGKPPLTGQVYAFSQNGDELYTLQTPNTLAVIPLNGGQVKEIKLPGNQRGLSLMRTDRWRAWQPEKNKVALFVNDPGSTESQLLQYDFPSGTFKTLIKREGLFTAGQLRWNTVLPQTDTVITTYQEFNTPPMLASFQSNGTPVPLVIADERASAYPLGRVEFLQTPYRDKAGEEQTLNTAVLLPPNWEKGKSFPVIAHQYAGVDISSSGLTYGGAETATIPTSIFTSRGYVVLLLDVPLGPLGTSQNIRTALKEPVLAQLNHAAELGFIDPARVAIMGQSFGGYAVAALLTDTTAFRAGVAVSGIYDLSNMYVHLNGVGSHWTESGQGRMGGSPWEKRELYIENSPFYQADRIQAPLMMVHGLEDQSAPPTDAQKMFMALKRLNKNADLHLYPRGGHVILEWPYEDAVDVTQKILDFLGKNLN